MWNKARMSYYTILFKERGIKMEIAEVLRKNGYKVTPQRLAVYDAIIHNPMNPNAETI